MNADISIGNYKELFEILKPAPMVRVLQNIHAHNVQRLKKKRKIKVAFQTTGLSSWLTDLLPRILNELEKFDVTIVVTWQAKTVYEQEIPPMLEYCSKSGFKYCFADGSIQPGDFDIIFYQTPYLFAFANFGLDNIPLDTLLCYIPYGYCVENLQPMMFNLFLHNVAWKQYVYNDFYRQMGERWCSAGNYNMVPVGSPKLDVLYTGEFATKAIWKIAAGAVNDVRKIIYAPHHSIDDQQCMSTFRQNWQWMLDYAKNHPNTTSWIYKPHPGLITKVVKAGIFASQEEYMAYCNEWDSLPNARFVRDDYLDYFRTSDCMIFDSMSFMAEYLFVNKPSLFLTREKLNLSELGEVIFPAHYHTDGGDFEAIQHFIEETVAEDPQKASREEIFAKYLEYYHRNGNKTAAEKIAEDLISEIYS